MSLPEFEMVVAWCPLHGATRGIGFEGDLPWPHMRSDMRRFKQITTSDQYNSVVMGRVTWEGLPDKVKPLPKRKNVVLSTQKDLDLPEGVVLAHTFDEALEKAADRDGVYHKVFVIGGAQIYKMALEHPQLTRIHQTIIAGLYRCDTYLPWGHGYPKGHWTVEREERGMDNGIDYTYQVLTRKR